MIPDSITLENFLSYRGPETLDLKPVSLAVISGRNGHGKSAIVDAMTWALWGEARKGSGSRKPDDDVLNEAAEAADGDTKMQVELDFRTGGETYRVRRSYRKTASGKTTESDLRFWTTNITGEPVTELTAGSQRETQKVIDNRVGMDFDLFTSTSLFLQGEWDSLLTATAAERKDLFFQLLQLGRFEEHEEKAKARRRSLKETKTQLDSRVEQLQTALEGADKRAELLEEKKRQLESAITELEKQERAHQEREDIASRLSDLASEQDQIQTQIEQSKRTISRLHDQKETLKDRLSDAEEKLSDLDVSELKETEGKLEKRRSRLEALQEKRQEAEQIRDSAQSKRQKAEDAESLKANRLSSIASKIEEIDEEWSSDRLDELETKKSDLEEALFGLSNEDEHIEVYKDNLRSVEEDLQSVREEISAVENEISRESEIKEQAESGEQERCVRCGTVMTDEHIEKIVSEAADRLDSLQQQKETLAAERAEYANEKKEAEASLENARATKEKRELLSRKIERVDNQIEQFTKERSRRDDLAKEKADIENGDLSSIGSVGNLTALKREAHVLNRKYQKAKVSKEAIEEARAKVQEAKDAASALQTAETIREQADTIESDIADVNRQLEEENKALTEAKQSLSAVREKMGRAEKAIDDIDGGTPEELESAETAVDTLKQEISKLEVRVEDDEDRLEQLSEAQSKIETVNQKKETADLLVEAFGRNGIPSMILEGTLPQIEDRANQMLDQLADEDIRIRMDTLREKKTGGMADTLDITVLSSGSERPYENLSGGESFRVTFAIRVALSQHLAASTGRPVRTLVIDEGFGTQDQEALDKIQTTIGRAAESFERVLVITHIQRLKDAFPQQIQVEKLPGKGSTFQLIT